MRATTADRPPLRTSLAHGPRPLRGLRRLEHRPLEHRPPDLRPPDLRPLDLRPLGLVRLLGPRPPLGWLLWLGLLLLSACASPGPTAATNVDGRGLALEGYDPTSYFEGAPRRGSEAFALTHAGATYRFVDAEHRARFAADPERFAPAYGGWCAWAVAEGYTYAVDPRSWLVQDDRLLLFYAGALGDTRAQWLGSDVDERLAAADRHWAEWRADPPPER